MPRPSFFDFSTLSLLMRNSLARLAALVLASASALLAQQAVQTSQTSGVYEVRTNDDARSLALLESFDVLGCCSGHVWSIAHTRSGVYHVVAQGDEEARLLLAFPAARLLERGRPFADIVRERAAASPSSPPDGNYFTTSEIEAELLALETKYPAIAKRIDLQAFTQTAKTHENRTIWALKISTNVAVDEDEPQTLIAGQHHARELNSPYMVLRAAQRVLEGQATDPTLQRVVREGALWFVPTVNPDGVEAVWNVDNYWRKNRRVVSGVVRGVDLNRNYPFRWGACGASSNATSQTYMGPSPASEPETQTMMAFARKLRFEKYLDFHSYGQDVLDTYSPCTSTSYPGSKLLAFHNLYRDRLAQATGYNTRTPSASGEAPEWHWAENGTMSFLVEVGTAFQPPFTSTVTEEIRVWPAVVEFLTWTPSFRGHTTSLRSAAPLEATIAVQDFAFLFGETTRTATSGRLHLWAPEGARSVTCAAPSHDSAPLSVTAPRFGTTSSLDPVLVPVLPAISVTAPATLPVGRTASIDLDAGEPNRDYWMPMALGSAPSIPIGPRSLALAADPIFWLSTTPLPGFYTGNVGRTDASGKASATFSFPNEPIFIGWRFWFAAVTFEPGWPLGVRAIAAPTSVQLVR
ncbi:MAG: hypothetical protein H6834_17525 [Planctomycetes bacterium]|nr:hypothetical protein [Planctomycetota bacterium]